MDKYIINGQIGEGAQGIVLKAHDSSRDQEVALKKILIKKIEGGLPTSIIREVKSLQQLKHPYVVELLDAFPNGLDFIMVFEYMPTGLWEVLRDFEISLTLAQIKTYMKMLLEGIAYVHGKNIMHRQMYVIRIFYNVKEFHIGETDIEQLAIVLKYLGSPTSESWPELTSLPDYNKITFPYHKSTSWENIIQDAQPEAIDLIRQILIYNSSKRLTAEQALCHTYFYSKPYPSMKTLIKPPSDHRLRVKSKEINPNVQPSTLFENLLSIV
ncbi:Cell division protein kinase 20 [Atta colombica]|uniref:Cyclin-dependent kinase 20 n=1 Tax=Atta colombica TaxID=520822 RepID=A0A195B2B2_9HYME|nr:Cell division protein kinase 20 [Atta colombica]